MDELGLNQVFEAIHAAFDANDLKRVEALLWPALDQYPDLPGLWFHAGNVAFHSGRAALSTVCFERCLELDESGFVLGNLGAAYRRLNQHEEGKRVLELALERDPNGEPALVNMGSLYVNEGEPGKGIPYLEKALALGEAKGRIERGVVWNLALLYLESARFAEGFDFYRRGIGAERLVRSYGSETAGIAEPPILKPEDPRTIEETA